MVEGRRIFHLDKKAVCFAVKKGRQFLEFLRIGLRKEVIMENRWSLRTAAHFEVRVTPPGRCPFRGRAYDISLGGLFVTNVDNLLEPDSVVEIDFDLQKDGETVRHRMPAQVVHVSEFGAGLMFCNFDAREVKAMRTMLYGAGAR